MILLALFLLIVGLILWRKRGRKKRLADRAIFHKRGRAASVGLVAAIVLLQTIVSAPTASAAGCGDGPYPESPGTGLVGALDPPGQHGLDGTAYLDYSYAGMVWHTYETKQECDSDGGTSVGASMDTWLGNGLFDIAKLMVGATNGLHYLLLNGGYLNEVSMGVQHIAQLVFNNIYVELFGIVALILSVILLWYTMKGNLSLVSKKAFYAILAMWLASSSLVAMRFFGPIDEVLVKGTTNIQAGFLADDTDQVAHEIVPSYLHNTVVYENWLAGEFGAFTTPDAKQYGRELLDAQAFTWTQMNNDDDSKQEVVDAKKAQYVGVYSKLSPEVQAIFNGEDAGRIPSGFYAVVQGIVYSLFQFIAKLGVLFAQVMLRIFILLSPLIGLIALLKHEIMERVGRSVGLILANLLYLSALAGAHAVIVKNILDPNNDFDGFLAILLAGFVTFLLFWFVKPVQRVKQIIKAPINELRQQLPKPPKWAKKWFRRRKKKGGDDAMSFTLRGRQKVFWHGVQKDWVKEHSAANPDPNDARPEAYQNYLATNAVLENPKLAATGEDPRFRTDEPIKDNVKVPDSSIPGIFDLKEHRTDASDYLVSDGNFVIVDSRSDTNFYAGDDPVVASRIDALDEKNANAPGFIYSRDKQDLTALHMKNAANPDRSVSGSGMIYSRDDSSRLYTGDDAPFQPFLGKQKKTRSSRRDEE